MKVFVYLYQQFPDASLVSWQAQSSSLTCSTYTQEQDKELRRLVKALLGRPATGRCAFSKPLAPAEAAFALAIAIQLASIDIPFSILVVGKSDLSQKLIFNTLPYQFGQVARRYWCDLILMPKDAKTYFSSIRRCDTLFDAVKEILSFKPSAAKGRYPFGRVQGLEAAKRAIMLSMAGRLHLLLVGPPGCGKTFLLSESSSFLSDTADFWIRASMSVSYLMEHRVFSLVAGGRLILDELPTLQRGVLERVRTEMDDNSDLLVHAAMNACPCGATGLSGHSCTCTEREKLKYWHKIGLPLLDRFDLKVKLRQQEDWSVHINTQITDWQERMERCQKHPPTQAMCLKTVLAASKTLDLSSLTSRGRFSLAKTALTIAEWEGKMYVDQSSLEEAFHFQNFKLEEDS